MYAETFNVREWLEEPAKWLRWAMQSNSQWKSEDARYNLQKFWATLAAKKTAAQNQRDWSEILTLDAQSQWALGTLYEHDASDLLKDLNNYRTARNVSIYASPIIAMTALNSDSDPGAAAYKSKLEQLQQNSTKAFQAQAQLAEQAVQAASAAGVTSQAGNTLSLAKNAVTRSRDDAAFNVRQADSMAAPPNPWEDIKKQLQVPWMGVPIWAWAAGAFGLLLLLTTAPAMAQAAVIRRAVEE